MNARSLATLSLLVAASGAGAQDAKVWYVPGSSKYVVTSSTKTSQEMQGQKQEFEATGKQQVSVTIGGSKKDSLDLSIVLDSISIASSAPGVPDVSKLIGTKLSGTMSPMGQVYAAKLVGPDGNEVKNAQVEGLRRFLPKLPASLKPGATWVDSSSSTVPAANGAMMTRNAQTTYTVLGDTTYDGEKAWRIGAETKAKIDGKGQQMGTDFTISGGSTSKATTYVSAKGVYLGTEGTENQDLTVTVDAAGLIIPVTSSTTIKIAKVK